MELKGLSHEIHPNTETIHSIQNKNTLSDNLLNCYATKVKVDEHLLNSAYSRRFESCLVIVRLIPQWLEGMSQNIVAAATTIAL